MALIGPCSEHPRRILEATPLVAEQVGVHQKAAKLERATPGEREPLAVALLAEAVAALLIAVPAAKARAKSRG